MSTVNGATRRTSKATVEKRGQGRPVVGENAVGKDRLLVVAEKLLRELPPARVTIARIAKEARVDPALVRYYFGDRTALLLAVAARMTADRTTRKAAHVGELTAAPDVALADHVRQTLRLTWSAPFMHRLMIEELAGAGTDESRSRVREMNMEVVAFYRRVLKADAGETMRDVNPLFLHLMVLGASDFFASAQPMIREIVPGNTNMDKLAAGYQEFLVKIVIDGLRKP